MTTMDVEFIFDLESSSKPKITFKEMVYDMAESDYKILYDKSGIS